MDNDTKAILYVSIGLLVVLLGALALSGKLPLSIVPLSPTTETASFGNESIAYTTILASKTYRYTNCYSTGTATTADGLRISREEGPSCEHRNSGYATLTLATSPNLKTYDAVTIRRSASLANICEGRYGKLTSTLSAGGKEISKEFQSSTGTNVETHQTPLGDIYISNDGGRIKIESDEGVLLLDADKDASLTITTSAGCNFVRGSASLSYHITGIETKSPMAAPLPPATTSKPAPTSCTSTNTCAASSVPVTTTATAPASWLDRILSWIKAQLARFQR